MQGLFSSCNDSCYFFSINVEPYLSLFACCTAQYLFVTIRNTELQRCLIIRLSKRMHIRILGLRHSTQRTWIAINILAEVIAIIQPFLSLSPRGWWNEDTITSKGIKKSYRDWGKFLNPGRRGGRLENGSSRASVNFRVQSIPDMHQTEKWKKLYSYTWNSWTLWTTP